MTSSDGPTPPLYYSRPRLSFSDSVVGPTESSRMQESLLEQGEAQEAAAGGTAPLQRPAGAEMVSSQDVVGEPDGEESEYSDSS